MKFISLLKKELKEMITTQMIVGLAVAILAFYFLGNIMGGVIEDTIENSTTINLCNQDQTEFTSDLLDKIQSDGGKINNIVFNSNDFETLMNDEDLDSIIVIPEGFSEDILNGKKADLDVYSKLKGTAMFSNLSGNISSEYANIFKTAISELLMSEKMSETEVMLAQDPLIISETTIVADKSAKISIDELVGYISTQTTFIPIIIFLLVILASQMIISAISTEKIDKTLETLLSAPVSRGAILAAKMLGAAIIGLIYAVVFMFAFNSFMDNMTGDILSSGGLSSAVAKLGLELGTADFLLIGIQLFLTIMIALSISLILGALAKDAKSAQSIIAPISISMMIPYFISMATDITTLPSVFRIILYIIPFTHSFTAISNVMMGNFALYWAGAAYQLIFLAICMYFAIRVFMTDKIFTISLNIGQKRKMRSFKRK